MRKKRKRKRKERSRFLIAGEEVKGMKWTRGESGEREHVSFRQLTSSSTHS